jgi:tetrahydromethanopterin S-methyltransferase subunit E
MKAYLITTGLIFGIMTILHIWRAAAEWPHPMSANPGFLPIMAILIVLPALLAWWAWRLTRKL